jgi:hypothetical protein
MFLYIGDVWVDEITSLQYATTQSKAPIYGYASQLWDDCAAGQVIVQGQFTINFKEQGYLWAVLRRFKNIAVDAAFAGGEGVKGASRQDKALGIDPNRKRIDRRSVWGSNATRTARASIERIVQGNAPRGEMYQFWHHLAGYSTFNVQDPKDKIFEDIVENFEDMVWQPNISNTDLNNQIRRTDDIAFDGFDMYVVFGNYSNPKANHTVSKIIDVRLMSQGKQVVIDGSPIQESYQFIAQTVA